MGYVLITPVRNEADNIPLLIEDVLEQSIRPVLWVIVDGNSGDGTQAIAAELTEPHDWIQVIRQLECFDELHSHLGFAQAVNEGYSHACRVASERGVEYEYVGKIDATPRLSKKFFESLLNEIESDETLAIVSGTEYEMKEGTLCRVKHPPVLSFSGFSDLRLYRRRFLETTRGYPLTPSPDIVLLIKARKMRVSISRAEDAWFIESRLGGTSVGRWKGYVVKGRSMHALGYTVTNVIISAAYYSVRFFPHQQGIALLFGYLLNILEGEAKVDDSDVTYFFGNERLNETLKSILSSLKMGW